MSGKKEYEGDWSAVTNKVFNFELFETDSTFTVNGPAKLVAVNDESGNFTFGTVSYTAAGTHYYVIREEKYGQNVNGIAYTSKEIRVTVVVSDNGEGMLIPTVTITDQIPQYTEYVTGSADNGGVLDGGVLTWNLTDIPADATVTVSFQVKVSASDVAVTNRAVVLEGENTIQTNQTTTEISTPSEEPDKTGDDTPVQLILTLMLSSVACIVVLLLTKKQLFNKK